MAKEKKNGQISADNRQQPKKILEFTAQEEEPVRKKSHAGFIWIVVILLIGGAVAYSFLRRAKYYNDFEVLSSTESSDSTQMEYAAYNNSLIKYSQEGISYLNKDGSVQWVESYKMKQPTAVVSGEYIAVADLNGNDVYLFDTGGKIYSLETPYTICDVDVASQGVFVVVLEDEDANFIEVYDKFGNNIAEMRITIADSGYPLDVALSNDGTKLVTSYLTIEGISIQNTIAAYNFGDVGQNEKDRLVGGFNNLGDTIVPKIEFLNNDTICAFGDNQFRFYSMKEKPSEKSSLSDFENEILSIFYNSKYVGVVERMPADAGVSEGEEEAQYRLRVFDTNGREKFIKAFNFTYDKIFATEQEIILLGGSECRIYDFQGNLRFSYCFPKEVKQVLPTGTLQKYIVVYDDATEMIKLRYTEEKTEDIQ